MGDSMTTKINATTTTGVIVQPDNSGALELQTNNGTTAVTIDTSQNATFAGKVTSAGALTLASNGTNTALTIDTSQNVGIGTTNPACKLAIGAGAPSVNPPTTLYTYNGTALGTTLDAMSYVSEFSGLDSNAGRLLFALHRTTAGGTSWTTSSWRIQPAVDGSFTGAGSNQGYIELAYGAAGPYQGIGLSGTGATTPDVRVNVNGYLLAGYTTSNGAYRLQVNSQIFATSATIATSDARYKTNIESITSAIELVNKLNPVSFDWKEHPIHEFPEGKTIGFLAQEVQEVLKDTDYVNNIVKTNECVISSEEKDDEGNITKEAVKEEFLGIAEGNLIPLLTKAIQEQQTIINNLTQRIEALESK